MKKPSHFRTQELNLSQSIQRREHDSQNLSENLLPSHLDAFCQLKAQQQRRSLPDISTSKSRRGLGQRTLRSSKMCHLQEKTQKLHIRGHAGGNVGRQASALSPVWRSVVRHMTQSLHRRRVMHMAHKDPHKTN